MFQLFKLDVDNDLITNDGHNQVVYTIEYLLKYIKYIL